MLKKLKRSNQGFTIIEVLIVLAIAALILLIVFLAVPALQRNARNTSRKSDVAGILAGINEYVGNNQGATPTSCSGTSPIIWGTAGTNTVANTDMGYYKSAACSPTASASTGTSGQVYLLTNPTAGTATYATVNAAFSPTPPSSQDYVFVAMRSTCNAAGNALQAGSTRSFAALYQIETGNNTYATVCSS